jgi:DNA-directed RNA polymerase subunit RPC12/RpoP
MHFMLLLIAGIVLWYFLHGALDLIKENVICRNCGSVGKAKYVSVSNFFIEILLWCAGLVPGVIYTLWCRHTAYNACSKCGSRDIVPVDSPVGRALASQHAADVTTPPGGQ